MKTCSNYEKNLKMCNCTYDPCPHKGHCCECIAYHRQMGELPACYFPNDVQRSYDRSIRRFMQLHT
ncbi:hypothetical protein U27_06933 [Candidatus Vecturithrix granuli]|uniref:Cytosolic protein n=1 Tax=Vecturithrix granuli TaxID=1499967 RepID=A0A081C5U2_VECG1|nr:hypothetical protein U27_06933 [Candidatus Vecturithrix granuli]